MAAPTPMGIAVTSTMPTIQSVPKIADWMPARSGKLEGKLVSRSRLSLGQPLIRLCRMSTTRTTRPTITLPVTAPRNAPSLARCHHPR